MTEHPDTTGDTRDVDAVWIDRGGGSGSLDAPTRWAQSLHSEYGVANDGRSDNRTTLYWKQSDDTPAHLRSRTRLHLHRDPEDRRSWASLAKKNDGVGESSRKQDNYDVDLQRWTQAFCSALDCNDYQEDRVLHIVKAEVDLSSFGNIPAEHVILATITLVVDTDVDVPIDEWTPDDWIVYRDDFESLMADLDMDRDRLWKLRNRVHTMADSFTASDDG